MARRVSQIRADIQREYAKRDIDWLEEKRIRLIWRLLGCERELVVRGRRLLPQAVMEVLRVAGRREKPSPPDRPWRHTYD